LTFIDDLERIDSYAWGAGCLAYLYRQLGVASRKGSAGVSGCLPLLQAWIYEYFPMLRPGPGYYIEGRPLVEAWSHGPRFKGDRDLLQRLRQHLDGVRAEQVRWMPYTALPGGITRTSLYTGFIRHLDIVEPYHPDRCMRQFGYVQTVPSPMPNPSVEVRPQKGNYRLEYGQDPDRTWGGSFGMHSATR